MRKNKLFIILVILTLLTFLCTAFTCSFCGINLSSDTTSPESEEGEEIEGEGGAEEETRQEETEGEGAEGEEEISEEVAEEEVPPEEEAPPEEEIPPEEEAPPEEENNCPSISYLESLDPAPAEYNGTLPCSTDCRFVCAGIDPDGDELTYDWDLSAGNINNIDNHRSPLCSVIDFTTPSIQGTISLTVTVSDGICEVSETEKIVIRVSVVEPQK